MGARKIILNFVSKMAPFLKSESEITTVLLCFKAPSVCIMKNLSKNKINRVRVPIVNKTKIVNGIF